MRCSLRPWRSHANAPICLVSLMCNLVLVLLVTVTAFGNLLQTASQFGVHNVGKATAGGADTASSSATRDWKLPDHETLPLGLGSGWYTGSVVRGLTHLVTVDPECEARSEAVALYAAYVLGLP